MKFTFGAVLLAVFAVGIPLNTASNVEKNEGSTGSLGDEAGEGGTGHAF